MLFNFFKKNNSLVFIVGVPRSGTTWMWGLLTSHPNVETLVREDIDPLNPSVVDGKRITSETGIFIKYDDKVVLSTINKKIKKHPEKILVEKTPMHILHIKKIMRLFPDAKIIHVLRDPRAVAASMLHSKFYKFANSIRDTTDQYEKCINAIRPFEKNPNVYTLKYEDLFHETRAQLTKVLDFIGLSEKYIEKMINENHKKTKVDLKGVYRKGKINIYKKELTPKQIKTIEK